MIMESPSLNNNEFLIKRRKFIDQCLRLREVHTAAIFMTIFNLSLCNSTKIRECFLKAYSKVNLQYYFTKDDFNNFIKAFYLECQECSADTGISMWTQYVNASPKLRRITSIEQ